MQEKNPFVLLTNENKGFKLKRVLLKDRAAELIRDHIVMGHLPPGTKLVEREVAKFLGMSRMPARDALLELEKEGLIVVKCGVRCVVELSEHDIHELYQVRLILEKAAVEFATQNTSPENRIALSMKLQEMGEAFDRKDIRTFIKNDLETHLLIWRQSNNNRLFNMLKSMVGPIFMFMATNAEYYPWKETVELHQELVAAINSGDTCRSVKSIERHINSALHLSLSMSQKGKIPTLPQN